MSSDIFDPVNLEAKPRSKKDRALWGPWRAAIGTVTSFLGAQVIIGILLSFYTNARHWSDSYANNALNTSIVLQFWYVLAMEAVALAIIWIFISRIPLRAALRALGFTRIHRRDFLYILIGVGVYYGVYAVVLGTTNFFMHVNTSQQQDIGFQTAGSTPLNLVLAFISLAVLPPIAEETIFRGFLFRGLRTKMPFLVATLITSLAFAYPHSLESSDGSVLWIAAIDTFSLSLVLCYLREKTGALYAGIGVHAIKNTIAFASLFIWHIH